jgi:Arc/MetJ-type ribon-helix-helix transcriptional regulator
MKRILVSMPEELHELMRELAVRKKTSVSRLVLAAVEDTYEDEIDVIAGEKGLQEYLADPSSSIGWEELKARLKAKSGVRA